MLAPTLISTLFPYTTLFRSRSAGFKSILLRGDTDFSQTAHLDRWDEPGDVSFLFGIDASPGLKIKAELLEKSAWRELSRPPRSEEHTSELQSRQYLVCRLLL